MSMGKPAYPPDVMPPVLQVVLRTANVSCLRWRCDAADPQFSEADALAGHTFIVPRTMTALTLGGTALIANPANVLFGNRYQHLRRRAISALDAADWFTLDDELLFQIVAEHDRNASYAFPFRVVEAAPPPEVLLESRVTADAIAAGLIDDSCAEEAVVRLATAFVRAAYRHRRGAVATPREIEGVEAVREWIARHPAQNASLAELALRAGMTVPRLCRLFRSRTGLTVTRFRHQVRMCLALELMTGKAPVLDIALPLGYSSHSHFTYFFRKIFGVAPSVVRKRLGGGDAGVRGEAQRLIGA